MAQRCTVQVAAQVQDFEAKFQQLLAEIQTVQKLIQDYFNKTAYLERRIEDVQARLRDRFRALIQHLQGFSDDMGGRMGFVTPLKELQDGCKGLQDKLEFQEFLLDGSVKAREDIMFKKFLALK